MLPPLPFVSPPEPPVPIRLYELELRHGAVDVAGGAAAPGVAGDDRVVSVAVPVVVQAAAASAGGVAADGAVGQGRRAADRPARRRRRPSCRLTVQSMSVAVPSLPRPPPLPVAELPLMVQSVSVVVPWLYRPPPSVLAEPPVMVRPEIAAVTPVSISKTRLVTAAADGHARRGPVDRLRPAVVAQLELALRQRDRLRRGEDGRVEGDRLGGVEHIGQVDGLAQAQLARGRAGAVAGGIDHQAELVWKAPMSGGESSGTPRWSVVTPLTAVPLPMAGLPGRRAMVWVGPP